jgi:hypothetical protein
VSHFIRSIDLANDGVPVKQEGKKKKKMWKTEKLGSLKCIHFLMFPVSKKKLHGDSLVVDVPV